MEGEGARICGNPGIKGTGSLRSREVENRIPKVERTERNRKQFCNCIFCNKDSTRIGTTMDEGLDSGLTNSPNFIATFVGMKRGWSSLLSYFFECQANQSEETLYNHHFTTEKLYPTQCK